MKTVLVALLLVATSLTARAESDCVGSSGVALLVAEVTQDLNADGVCLIRIATKNINQHGECPMTSEPGPRDWVINLKPGCPKTGDTVSGLLKLHEPNIWELIEL